MSALRSVIVEADGGSRGNPGPAAYGAVLKDTRTGEVLAQTAETIGTATNNVAEYRGLIAGLELAAMHAPDADLEVRMDSKLVVEQMSGNWKIKHPSLRPLAVEASRLAPFGTTYTWIPRERNTDADRLVNLALDGVPIPAVDTRPSLSAEPAEGARPLLPEPQPTEHPTRGWSAPGATVTTLILLRHGATSHNAEKRFSGGFGGSDPILTDDGRAQARAAAEQLMPVADEIAAVVASPLRRTQETAAILGERLAVSVAEDPGLVEMEFGSWEGLTVGEIIERDPDLFAAWRTDPAVAAAGDGESFVQAQARIVAARDRILAAHGGDTVVVVSHVTPIKLLVADALGVAVETIQRMELAPAAISVVSYFDEPDGTRQGSLRSFNLRAGSGWH